MLADLAGLDTLTLLAAEGKPPPEGVTFLESSSSSGLRARLPRPLRSRRAHRDAGTWPEWMKPSGNDAATIIGAAVASAVHTSAEQPWFTDPPTLLVSVARAAERWEPPLPDGQAGLLRPLAEVVASASAASWWWEPADLRHQRWVGCDHHRTLRRGADVARAVEAAEEDPLGEEEFEVWAVGIDPDARVYEVHEPGDWGWLAATHPRDVTASRWHDWGGWTGREGRWILPDWRSVAAQWDGVHVSVAGYLSTAGMAVESGGGGGSATLLAGWDADQTLWLRDVFTDTRQVTTWHGTPGPEALC